MALCYDTGIGVAEALCDQKQRRARLWLLLGVSVHILPGKNRSSRGHGFQRYLREMTLSPDGVLGSSMARRDKTSAWSAIYLL